MTLGCPEADPADDEEPSTTNEAQHRWLFVFIVPNDNDLDRNTGHIIEQIRGSLRGDEVAATMLVDRRDSLGLEQIAATSSSLESERLDTEDSTDVETLQRFLTWSSERFPADRTALCLLGHGGRIDEVLFDLAPEAARSGGERSAAPSWASQRDVARAIRRWKRSLRQQRLDLLFLHQCGRGTLEGLYHLRDTSDVIVLSETFVGAPNTYYGPLLELAAANPELDGLGAANAILDADNDAAALAIIDGSRLAEIPGVVDQLANALQRPDGAPLLHPRQQIPAYLHAGEATYDVCAYLGELARINGIVNPQLGRQLDWIRLDLVRRRTRHHRTFPFVATSWCGVAMLVEPPPNQLDQSYRQSIELYQSSQWLTLHDSLAPPMVQLGAPSVVTVAPQPPSPPSSDELSDETTHSRQVR